MPARGIPVISRPKPVAPSNPEGVAKVNAALRAKRKKGVYSLKSGNKPKGWFSRFLMAFRRKR